MNKYARWALRIFAAIVISSLFFDGAEILLKFMGQSSLIVHEVLHFIFFLFLVIFSCMLTSILKSKANLKEVALRDSLTGLYSNREFMLETIKHLLLRTKRSEEIVLAAFIDLNDLKKINDTFSHQTGDDAIITAGDRITSVLRETDYLFRYGGDEFVAIFTTKKPPSEDAGKCEIEAMRSRIKEAVGRNAFVREKHRIPLNVSVGIHIINATKPIDDELDEADKDMYEDKKNKKPFVIA